MVSKKITIILIVLALIFSGIGVYIDRVVLKKDLKLAIIEGMEKASGKKVVIRSVSFNLFKGLVIHDLIVSDNNVAIINSREVSCMFLVLPLFKKQVIVPSIKFKSPEIFVERKSDNSINLVKLFEKNTVSKSGFNFFIRRISIRNANVNFYDSSLSPAFSKKITSLDLDVYFALPSKTRFNFEFSDPADPIFKIKSKGEYDIGKNEFTADLNIGGVSLKLFKPYYEKTKISFPEGRCDADVKISSKNNQIVSDLTIRANALVFSKDDLVIRMISDVKAVAKYLPGNGYLEYSGIADVQNMMLSGIGTVGTINRVRGHFAFDNSGISSDDIKAEVLGMPVTAKFELTDFSSPAIRVDMSSDVSLAALQDILKGRFNITIPAILEGKGRLYVGLEYELPQESQKIYVGGFLDMFGAKIIFGKNGDALENVNGRFNFTGNQVVWPDLKFKYHDILYRTSGMLTNFDTPGVQMKLSAKDMSVESIFGINDKLITFSKLAGKYLNSSFSVEGNMDISGSSGVEADLNGKADIDLSDLKDFFKKSKEKILKMKLAGVVHGEFSLRGNVSDFKSFNIDAKLSSDSISFYDFKSSDVFMNYRQKEGKAEIPFIHALLYGGAIDASVKFDLLSDELPYSVTADIKGLKLEQLKKDTSFKDKDVAGVLYIKSKISGHSGDISRLSGSGSIAISNGNLWQLNLFKGMGVLLFTSDFSKIIFKEGSCDFVVGGGEWITDELILKSDLLHLYGPLTIDMQGDPKTVKAELKAEFQDEGLSNARRNITTAMGKYSMIEISGTLKDPKYNLKPDMGGIIEDIAERFVR